VDKIFVLSVIAAPQSEINSTAGSPLWQMIFASFAVVLVLFETLRGWRRGVARQLARLGALTAAYFAAFFGGKLLLPLVRPFFRMPDAVMSILAGAALALIVYAVINGLGTILFKRTDQHQSAFVRLLYGFSGALLGVFFGAFSVWLLVVTIRSAGAVADAQAREPTVDSTVLHAVDVRRRFLDESNEQSAPLMTSLARLKNSLEMGVIGGAIKKTDVIPAKTYDTLGKIGQVVSSPQTAERFLSFPGARELSQHPKVVALRNDQEISEMLGQGRFLDLLQDPRIIDAANDQDLCDRLKKFDLNAALDYAVKK
jgi:uncharacterized membrane protein required for colicin V production